MAKSLATPLLTSEDVMHYMLFTSFMAMVAIGTLFIWKDFENNKVKATPQLCEL